MSDSLIITTYQVRYRVSGTTTWNTYLPPTQGWQSPINDLSPDTLYEFQVIATNPDGSTLSKIVQTKTDNLGTSPPGTPVASNISNTSVVLNWAASTGTPPIYYQPQISANGAPYINFGPPLTTTSVVLTGLQPSTNYGIIIVASNAGGAQPSPAIEITTAATGTPPSAPGNIAASAVDATDVALTWTASTSGAAPITYQPQYRITGTTNWAVYGAPLGGTSVTISGLAGGTSYDFQVVASNSYGSVSSAIAEALTPVGAVAPAAPGTPTASNLTATSATISWAASASGTPPISYQVQYRIGTGNWTNVGAATTSLSENVGNLSPSTSYTFQVIASNGTGSAPSGVLTVTTPVAVPAPTAPVLQYTVLSAPGQVQLVWSASVGSGITYTPQYRPTGSTIWANATSTASTSATITGLPTSGNYDFQILAANVGGSAASNVLTASLTIAATTWNGADSLNVVISNAGLTATSTASAGGIRANSSRISGKYYAEFALTTAVAGERVGLADATWTEQTPLGAGVHSIGLDPTGAASLGGTTTAGFTPAWTAGGTLGIAVDLSVGKLWATLDGTNWDASGSGDSPVTGTGGTALTGLAGVPLMLAYSTPASTSIATTTGTQTAGNPPGPVLTAPSSGQVSIGNSLTVAAAVSDNYEPTAGNCILDVSCASGTVALPKAVIGSGFQAPVFSRLHVAAGSNYLLDDNNRAVILRGNHTWNNGPTVLGQAGGALDYTAYINLLASMGCNYYRMWSWNFTAGGGSLSTSYTNSVFPFVQQSGGLYDLTQYNQTWFNTLLSLVQQAAAKNIYVSVMLFFMGYGYSNPTAWNYSLWNGANNVNGTTTDITVCETGGDATTLSLQKAFIAKVLDTLQGQSNVLYEIDNEAYEPSLSWQNSMVDYIHSYIAGKGYTPQLAIISSLWLNGSGVDAPTSNSQMFATDADLISVNGGNFQSNQPDAPGTKPGLADTDHTFGIGGNGSWIWQVVTRGYSVAVMDDLDGTGIANNVTFGLNSTEAPERLALQQVSAVAAQFDFTGATSQQGLASTGYCLANPSAGYFLIHAPSGGSFTVNLSGYSGTLKAQWVDVVNSASLSNGGTVQGGSTQTFNSPTSVATLVLTPNQPSVAGGSLTTSNGGKSLAYSDVYGNCQTALEDIVYSPPALTGSDTLTVQFNDPLGGTATLSVPLTVLSYSTTAKTLNAGETAFAYAVPTGFSAWDNYIPAPLGGLTVSAVTASGATVSWAAPAYGTVPISYQVQYMASGGSSWTTAGTTTSLSFAITGLTTATSYSVRVIPVNSVGGGAYSSTSFTTT